VYYSLLRKSRQRKIIIVLLCVHVSVSADEALGRGDIREGRVTVLNSVYTIFRYWVEQYFYVNQSMTKTTYPREYLNGFLRTKPTRPSYDLAPPPSPLPPLPSASCLSFSVFFCVAYGRGGRERGKEPNHTTSRKLGPLQIAQYSLTYPIHLFWGKEPCGWYCVCCLAQAI